MLEIENLSFHTLLKDFTLRFNPGEIHAILGPNGAGKSTLLKTLAGIWNPTSGQVLWLKTPLFQMSRRQISNLITFVPQNPSLVFDYTVEEFVRMGRYSHGMKGSIQHALEVADVSSLSQRPIQQISQGERQRVYLARALATEAPVMLFDEPGANLDVRHTEEMWKMMGGLARQGKVVLIANHDLQNSKRHCSHTVLIHEGHCISSGLYADIMTPATLSNIFGI